MRYCQYSILFLSIGFFYWGCSSTSSQGTPPSDDDTNSELRDDSDTDDLESTETAEVIDSSDSESQSDPDTQGGLSHKCEDEDPEPIFCGENCEAIENNGPVSNRVSLVLIGDGFTASDIENSYIDLAYELADYMFANPNDSQPYVRYRKFINFYRIDLPSNESGVDRPDDSFWVDTPLDGEEGCTDWTIGMCQVNWEKTHNAIENALKNSDVTWTDWRFVTLNTHIDCGAAHYPARGTLAVYCPYLPQSPDIALHEGGHAFHGLADTYWTKNETYSGAEPSGVNLTKDPGGAKWSHWLGYEDPILGIVDAYEGGGQYQYGLYRPSYNQKMGSAEYCHFPGPPYCPHDAVSREKIILDIYDIVDPLDGWADNTAPLRNPEQLWVDVVDCDVIKVDWYVDGALVAENFKEFFAPAEHDIGPGKHIVKARAHDDTKWVRADRETLEQTIEWEIEID